MMMVMMMVMRMMTMTMITAMMKKKTNTHQLICPSVPGKTGDVDNVTGFARDHVGQEGLW